MEAKRFVVRKYIYAKSAKDAILKERGAPVDDVWVDEDWKKLNDDAIRNEIIGFKK